MKIKLKGFTLVELIIVMAMMAILMAGIMNLFSPIRETYVDTTQYEAQRTAQNGVVQYISESVRYATDLGVYDSGKGVTSASKAVEEFAIEYCKNAGILDKTVATPTLVSPYTATDQTNVVNEIKKYAEVIIIDNNTPHYSKGYWGRVIRRKVNMTSPTAIGSDPTINVGIAQTIAPTDKNWRTALGEAFYGENCFQINVLFADTDDDGTADGKDGMLNLSVVSTRNGKRDISNVGKDNIIRGKTDTEINSKYEYNRSENAQGTDVRGNITRGGVLCRNLVGTSNKGVSKQGFLDISKYSGSSVTNGQKTYIVFLRNDDGYKEKDKVEKVVKAATDSHATP